MNSYVTRAFDYKFYQYLGLVLLSLSIIACTNPESDTNNAQVSSDEITASLPAELKALALDETNLIVEIIDNGKATRVRVLNLTVDTANKAFSGQLTLDEGSHTLSLIFSVIDPDQGTVEVAQTSGIDVNVIKDATTPADFSAATITLTDTDGDSISNLDELDSDTDVNVADHFTISGSVTGLSGTGLALQLNDGNDLVLTADGAFSFSALLADGSEYTVNVTTQPNGPNQTCTVSNGSGTLSGANVTDVEVACSTMPYTVNLNVTGLQGNGLVLQNNGTDDLVIDVDGSFSFTPLVDGSDYAVAVVTQPSGPDQACTVSKGSGTLSGTNITDVTITCTTTSYPVGGNVIGLAGTGLVLQNNDGDSLAINSNGNFTFTPLTDGSDYKVTVISHPHSPNQICTVTNGTGALSGTNVTDVVVTCITSPYSVGVNVSGLAGTGLVLQNNNGDDLAIASNGLKSFSTKLADGSAYAVTVKTHPGNPTQTCRVTNGTGTLNGANVTNVAITCDTVKYSVGVNVSGLAGTGLVLQNNNGDDLAIDINGSITFSTPLIDGSTYEVTVKTLPGGQSRSCSVSNGSGTLSGANVTNVRVTCVDKTPPTVSSTAPAASSTGVSRNTMITATFDEDIFAATVDGSSFTLANGGDASGSVSFDGATNIATFDPDSNLAMLTSYSATLTTSINDLSGNSLASDYSWSFTTGDGAWGKAELIETNDLEGAFSPQIAIDSAGNAMAVWAQGGLFINDNIWANRYVAGTGWGTAQLIETNDLTAFSPQIAIDSAGNAIAVWVQGGVRNQSIWANRYVAGTGWGTAELIETNDLTAGSPQIAIDSAGNAIAVWPQGGDIWANRYVAGTGWGTAELIETNDLNAGSPQIAIDSAGNAFTVWQQGSFGNDIWANRYVVGAGWGKAALIETNLADAWSPQIAIDSAGNAIAVWQRGVFGLDIWANRYVVGTGWGTAELIETTDLAAGSPQIAIDSAGNAIAVWAQGGLGNQSIWANRNVAGKGWGAAELIETNDLRAGSPQIAIDSAGNAIAVWQQVSDIWANRYVVGAGWGKAALIETDGLGNAQSAQISIDNAGNAIVVWGQSDGTRSDVWANRFE